MITKRCTCTLVAAAVVPIHAWRAANGFYQFIKLQHMCIPAVAVAVPMHACAGLQMSHTITLVVTVPHMCV